MKKCRGPCGLEKDESEFDLRTDTGKLRSQCRECRKKYHDEYRQDHKEEISIRNNKYREDNKEEIKIFQKEYRDDHKEESKEYKKIYRQENKKEINRKNNEYIKNKRKQDPIFKLRTNISRSINRSVKNGKMGESILKYLGDDYPQRLKARIEETWGWAENLDENGNIWMSWENYGPVKRGKKTWQIDHKKPQTHPDCQYNTMGEPGFLECWRIDNLQAMESFTNIKKSNKY